MVELNYFVEIFLVSRLNKATFRRTQLEIDLCVTVEHLNILETPRGIIQPRAKKIRCLGERNHNTLYLTAQVAVERNEAC